MRLPVSRSACATTSLALLFALLLPPAAGAFSIIGDRSANGGLLTLHVSYGFEDASGGGASALLSAFESVLVPGSGGPPSGVPVTLAPGTLTALPTATSTAKDQATVTPSVVFAYGAPWGAFAADQLSLDVSGIVSAEASSILDPLTGGLVPANATVKVVATLLFFVDTFAEPAGTVVGSVQLPALRALLPFELELQASLVEDETVTVGSVSAGEAALSAEVRTGHSYRLDLRYGARAPFGTDPPFSIGVLVPMTPIVPEPAALTLLGSGLVALAAARRQRQTRTAAGSSP